MKRNRVSTASVVFLLAVSIFGIVLVPVLSLQPNLEQFGSIRSVWIGILYSAICLLGTSAVFYPGKCRGIFQKTQNPVKETGKSSDLLQLKGHHPDCANYLGNTIRVGGRRFCAACSGLLTGAVIALIGAGLYFFVGLSAPWIGFWSIVLGEVFMVLGLAQIMASGYLKVLMNLGFVVGSFVMLFGVDALSESLLLDLYVVGLIGFLLWVRILLSEWNNVGICQKCDSCFQ